MLAGSSRDEEERRSSNQVKGDFLKRRALQLPPEARYDTLIEILTGAHLGAAIVKAIALALNLKLMSMTTALAAAAEKE